jgi:hypothetical protein
MIPKQACDPASVFGAFRRPLPLAKGVMKHDLRAKTKRKTLHKSALKRLKSLRRVTLCAGSETHWASRSAVVWKGEGSTRISVGVARLALKGQAQVTRKSCPKPLESLKTDSLISHRR